MTEFGGAVAVPSAVRSSDSTTTMRVNDVIMIRIDGAIDSTVSSAINWIARSVTPPLPAPPRLMLISCANAGPANDPAAIRMKRNKTLRGWAAGLTKATSGVRAGMPSRLQGVRNRISDRAVRLAAPPTARCAERGRPKFRRSARDPAVRERPAVRLGACCRLPDAAARPRGVAPSRRDFDRRWTWRETVLRAPAGAAGTPAARPHATAMAPVRSNERAAATASLARYAPDGRRECRSGSWVQG